MKSKFFNKLKMFILPLSTGFLCVLVAISPLPAQQKTSIGFNPLKHLTKMPGWLVQTEGKAFKKENAKKYGIAAGAIVAAYFFDDNVDRFFKQKQRFPDTAHFFDKTGHLLNQTLWTGFYMAGMVAQNEKLVSAGQAMIVAELGANLLGGALWFGLGRERPGTAPDHHTFHPFDTDNLDLAFPPFKVLPSFPSSHVSGNFSIATVLVRYYGFKAGLPMFLFGTATGFSRIARQGHYLSDIIGGAFLGTIFGIAATQVVPREKNFLGNVMIMPQLGGRAQGIVVRYAF